MSLFRAGLLALLALIASFSAGCGTQPADPTDDDRVIFSSNGSQSVGEVTQADVAAADLSVLVLGNSHSTAMPGLLETLYAQAFPGKKMYARYVFGGFLDDIELNPATRKALDAGPWDVVILQAQKISMSRREYHPRDAAQRLATEALGQGAQVLLFAEWPRFEIDETEYIEEIYERIATAAPGAKVVPVGRVWEAAFNERPELTLHAPDGNHANEFGNYLTACALFRAMNKDALPEFAPPANLTEVSEADARFFQKIAAGSPAPRKNAAGN